MPLLSASAQPIRLGIIGCGIVTRSCHLPALARIPQMRLAFLCDQNVENARALKSQFGLSAVVTANVADLTGQIDAAIVAVPPRFHASVSMELLNMGVDVFCEKPLALSVSEASRMLETAEQQSSSGRGSLPPLRTKQHHPTETRV